MAYRIRLSQLRCYGYHYLGCWRDAALARHTSVAPNSLAREGGGAGGSLPSLTQAQVDGVWKVWGKYVKVDVPGMAIPAGGKGRDVVDANIGQLKMLLAQAVLFRRDSGLPSIAMRQVIAGIMANGDGKQISLGFGLGNETTNLGGGNSRITIERSSDVQMVVSVMHELLHATDMMKYVAGMGVLEISSNARHEGYDPAR